MPTDILAAIREAGMTGIIFPDQVSISGVNPSVTFFWNWGILHDCGEFDCPHHSQITPIIGEYDIEGFAHVWDENETSRE